MTPRSNPDPLTLLHLAIQDTIAAYGTDQFNLKSGIAMGIALATHPEGITSQFLERDIANAVTSQHPIEQLKAILRRLDDKPADTYSRSITGHEYKAVALAVGEALAASESGERREYHVLAGIAIGISRLYDLRQAHTYTPLDLMICDAVANDDVVRLYQVILSYRQVLKWTVPISRKMAARLNEDIGSFSPIENRILRCGLSQPPRDDVPVVQRRGGPLTDKAAWEEVHREAIYEVLYNPETRSTT